MDVQSRLLLGGIAGVAGAVWGWLLGFDGPVIAAIVIGAALPAWVLSRLAVINAPTSHEGLLRSLDEIAARPTRSRTVDIDDDHLADVYVLVPRGERQRPEEPRPLRRRTG
jgi:hypothetical protein